MPDDSLLKEYYAILDLVKDYDKNLLTIKGWAVTLSLAALGLGFQYRHYGFFIFPWLGAQVALPHAISVIVGGSLCVLGFAGLLGKMPL
ncbi:MAG: hypothetical protein WCF84_07700 [Anaerolineae bacterium]